MNLLHSIPTGLLALLCALPILSAAQSTPNDPFHELAKLAPKAPEPPICCLKPLPSQEPSEELILSFEDWKAKQAQLQADGKLKDTTNPAAPAPSAHEPPADVVVDPQPAPPVATEAPSPPHFRVPLTDRFNYASLDCSARVHLAHKSAKHPENILSSKRDRYMLSPCETPGEEKSVVVELCDDIWIDTVQLANFEFFSGVFKDFSISVAKTYTKDPNSWTPAGTFRAKNIRGIQSFHPPALRDFYRFIKIDFHSFYGNEYYCPLSLLRVYGLTHLEQWKWDQWEAESRAKKGEIAEPVASPVTLENSTAVPVRVSDENYSSSNDTVVKTGTTVHSDQQSSTLSSPPASSTTDPNRAQESDIQPVEEENEAASEQLTVTSTLTTSVTVRVPPSSVCESSSTTSSAEPTSTLSATESNQSAPTLPSSSASSASSEVPASPTVKVSTSVIPTIVPVVNPPVPAVPSAGESIYRTIMTRLGLLEQNATLYLRYVEEQTRTMRDALRRLEEDVGRIEGIGKAQAQHFLKVTQEWEKQRKRLEREQGELLSRVDFLAEEIVLEKRLGVAQLCLLLTVLIFLALTRGSRGETLLDPRLGGHRSLREWGRRHLSSLSSGEWRFGSRTRSVTPPPPLDVKPAKPPSIASKPAGVIFPSSPPHDVDEPKASSSSPIKYRTPSRTPSHKQLLGHLKRPSTPNNTPVPTQLSILSPHRPRLRRTSSHNSPAAGLVMSYSSGATPTSVRKWARTAHLHELRRGIRRNGDATPVASSAQSTPGQPLKRADENEDEERRMFQVKEERNGDDGFPFDADASPRRWRTREPLSRSNAQNIERRDEPGFRVGLGLNGDRDPQARMLFPSEVDADSESWLDTDAEGSELGEEIPSTA